MSNIIITFAACYIRRYPQKLPDRIPCECVLGGTNKGNSKYMLTFEETGLRSEIITAVTELGYESPTKIQEEAIPSILTQENDLIALAQTGTGKTAAFGLPIVHKVNPDLKEVQALILCPTRELCIQIQKDLESFAKYLPKLNLIAVYGGTPIYNQIRGLRRGCHVVVGTPGRTLDLINRGELKVENIHYLVLDEADEMLNMGFQKDLDAILAETPEEKQTFLFSATMPHEIARISKKYMDSPVEISVGERNSGSKDVSHEFYMVHARDRYEALKRIADIHPDIYGIIFCRTKRDTKDVARKLTQDGYDVDALYGDLTQAQRDEVMGQFRSGNLQLLVATDVAARGIDVNELTHVINYELPDDLEVYIHRSGRTGRAGNTGVSISIIHTRETRKIRQLEQMAGKKFTRKMVPTGKEICERQLLNLVDKVGKIDVNEQQIAPYLPAVYEQLESLSREELIQRFISVEFNRFLTYYKHARDLNVNYRERSDRYSRSNNNGRDRERYGNKENGRRGDRRLSGSFKGYYVNLGYKNQMSPTVLINLVNELLPRKRVRIGKIDINKKRTYFEVDQRFSRDLSNAFKNADYEGITLNLEVAEKESSFKQDDYRHEDDGKRKRKRRRKKR